jgi:hypothetical protein
MDGLFPSLMPYGRKDLSLLYHVEQSVIATEVSDRMNPLWLRPDLSPFHDVDKAAYFRRFKEACAAYLPAVAGARLAGFLEGPRMVMAYHEVDDARPSLINKKDGNRYLTVFSGKVDHSLQIAEQVVAILREAI